MNEEKLLEDIEQQEKENVSPKEIETREQKIEREKTELLNKLSSDNLTDIHSKVAFILNHFPNTRNSDISLTIRYWKTFDKDLIGLVEYIDFQQLYKVTRMGSLIRARAKIQNTYGLFLAKDEVRQRRSELSEERRLKEAEDQPGFHTISIFCDESGKNDDNLVIGSLWINDPYKVYQLYKDLSQWKETNLIKYEFHFSELKRQKIGEALEFYKMALSSSDVIGFKAVIINKRDIGQSHLEEAVFSLHYQLIIQGLEHEIATRRINLPRELSITKDKDDGSDKLRLAALKQKLKTECVSYFKDAVEIGGMVAEDSKGSVFLQLADLFAGSISRIINKQDADLNHKDEFAHSLLGLLGVNDNLEIDRDKQDFVEIIRL